MKIKKLSIPIILFAITIVAYIAATLLCCYTTKPAVSKGEFSFSITYEYKGETKTLSGVFVCSYSGSDTVQGEHSRYWDGEVKYDNPDNVEYPYIIESDEEKQTTLSVQPNMEAGYFMGDPLYRDHYQEYGLDGCEPYIEYYDYKNEISLNDENRDEVLSSIGFKIIECTYEKPIENSFSFAGISYEADNVIIFLAITLLFLILCLILVRKDEEYQYSKLDKMGALLNLLIGIVALPFISLVCILFGLVESDVHLINQITYNVPPIAVVCLALSVVLRRKGISKPGFFVQFGGILLFALVLVLDTIF